MISHCCSFHQKSVFKYREYVSYYNKHGYQSKLHEGITPVSIRCVGSEMIVNNNMVLICECRQRLNTPVKVGQASSDFNEDNNMNPPSDE